MNDREKKRQIKKKQTDKEKRQNLKSNIKILKKYKKEFENLKNWQN